MFSKVKADRTYPVHWTSILGEDCTKSVLSSHENASLWWKEIKIMFFYDRENLFFLGFAISHYLSPGPFLKLYTNH